MSAKEKSNLAGKNIMVTGGAGFLGSYVIERLKKRGCNDLFIPLEKDFDLTREGAVTRLFKKEKFDIVIHLAAVVGGIASTKAKPGKFFYDNLMMGALLMEKARLANVDKFVAIGTVCCYPKFTPIPFKEENLWDGYPEETNAPYGMAKKMLLVQSQAYRQQYGFNSIFLMPLNLYGPKDNFSPEASHVIPALIRKCFDAMDNNEDKITVWGSGRCTRGFLYVDDCAEAVLLAAEKYNKSDPVNIGSDFEVSIKELAEIIVRLTGFKGRIERDPSMPDGQPRRCLDTSCAYKEFGFKAKTDFEEGLKKTIDWYKKIRYAG
jgi:GDP-L-fucose synthase